MQYRLLAYAGARVSVWECDIWAMGYKQMLSKGGCMKRLSVTFIIFVTGLMSFSSQCLYAQVNNDNQLRANRLRRIVSESGWRAVAAALGGENFALLNGNEMPLAAELLFIGAQRGKSIVMVSLLSQPGVQNFVNRQDDQGNTPLMVALLAENPFTADQFFERDHIRNTLNLDLKNNEDQTVDIIVNGMIDNPATGWWKKKLYRKVQQKITDERDRRNL